MPEMIILQSIEQFSPTSKQMVMMDGATGSLDQTKKIRLDNNTNLNSG